MKKHMFNIFLFLVLLSVGCAENNNSRLVEDEGVSTTNTTVNPLSVIDYTNYSNDNYSIIVKNDTSKRLVAFVGSPSKTNLISGIPAKSENHGLKQTEFFSKSTDFVLFLVTEEDYKQHINDLSKLDAKPFTKLYCIYNKAASNSEVYEISAKLGAECSVTFCNTTNYNVVVHQDGIYGSIIGFVPGNSDNITYSLSKGDYYFYFVLVRYDQSSGEFITTPLKVVGGEDEGRIISAACSLTDEFPSYTIDISQWINAM